MKKRIKFIFSISVLLMLLVLIIACTTTDVIETPISLTSTPSANISPTSFLSNEIYTSTLTSIPSTLIAPSPTEFPISIPDGRVLFVGNSIKADVNSNGLVLLNLKTRESILVVRNNQELNGQTLSLSYPNITWSPDGHRIAFVAINIENNFFWYAQEDIYIVKSDGTGLRRLTNSPHYSKRDIAWSPDGEYILVAMGINGSDLYLIDATSGEIVKRLTSNGNNYVAVWSPDGNKIAYIEKIEKSTWSPDENKFTLTKNSALLIMDVTDKTSQQIDIPSDHYVLDISWSPNDEQVAFTSIINESQCADVFIINIKTIEMTNLTSSKYYERFPNWLPDGNNLAFSKSVDICDERVGPGKWDIYTTNLLGEEHKIIANVDSTIAWAPVPSLELGKRYIITELGAFLNLRTEPSLNGKILKKTPAGEIITVLEGFVDADDHYWWKIRTQDGTEGWAVEVANWYNPITE